MQICRIQFFNENQQATYQKNFDGNSMEYASGRFFYIMDFCI